MDEVITRASDEYQVLEQAISKAKADVLELISRHQPSIAGEVYLTTEQVCQKFHISRRALQCYRNNWTIPHTSIAGKILYPLSEIERLLERNYHAPLER